MSRLSIFPSSLPVKMRWLSINPTPTPTGGFPNSCSPSAPSMTPPANSSKPPPPKSSPPSCIPPRRSPRHSRFLQKRKKNNTRQDVPARGERQPFDAIRLLLVLTTHGLILYPHPSPTLPQIYLSLVLYPPY